jgi:hypothetical protein
MVEGAHDVPPQNLSDRWRAQRELWARDGLRGEMRDAIIVAWNLAHLAAATWRSRCREQ